MTGVQRAHGRNQRDAPADLAFGVCALLELAR
jgi:hypothetical protein